MDKKKFIKEHTEILLGIESGEILSQNDPDLLRLKEIEKELSKIN